MADFLLNIACLVAGYLLGSLNTSVIVGRIYGQDIRSHGSKSAGLTNALRVLGKKAAVIVLAGDILKGVLSCLVGSALYTYFHQEGAASVGALAAGAGAVIGHNWPLYFNFKGGKGALTAAAVMFMVDWTMALPSIIFFVSLVALTRYVSLGTIGATIFFVVISFLPVFEKGLYFHILSCLLAAVIIFKHRANIQRLMAGTENKLVF